MLRWLFLDLNSYFASVEQQLEPALRGRPVAVSPVDNPSGTCIAASYEAKAFGVKTGVRVGEARLLCPDLVVVPPRSKIYVEFHHKVIEAVEKCLPVSSVHSIDEVACRLSRDELNHDNARALARQVKVSLREHVGEYVRASIGLAPNAWLAKIATDMQKPDGLVLLDDHNLRESLLTLKLDDLPGVGPRMLKRLNSAGIRDMEQMLALSEGHMKQVWGGIVGQQMYLRLRGDDLGERVTHRRSIGHQHVLPPARRNEQGSWEVATRLLQRAAARVRHYKYAARWMTVVVRYTNAPTWTASECFDAGTDDSVELLLALRRHWARRPMGTPLLVSVTLHELLGPGSYTPSLFRESQSRSALSRAMDEINARFGSMTVYPGILHGTREASHGAIAFKSIPDLSFIDSVKGNDPKKRERRSADSRRPSAPGTPEAEWPRPRPV